MSDDDEQLPFESDEERRRREEREAAARRDEALSHLEHVESDAAWRDYAYDFCAGYLYVHESLFVDDLWRAGLERPRQARTLGVIMQRLARDGLMEKTGDYRMSVSSNLSAKPVWRSLIHQGAP